MKKPVFYAITFALALMASSASAQVTFTDVADAAGLGDLTSYNGGIHTWADYDNDGYPDIALSGIGFRNGIRLARKLYHNEGDGTFADVTRESGTTEVGTNTAIFLDFDNDGYLDMFISGTNSDQGDLLYRNRGDGTFADMSRRAGMIEESRMNSCCFDCDSFAFDYNNDGFIDIFVNNFGTTSLFPNFLYLNQGDGTFAEMAEELGLSNPELGALVPGDYDSDGDADLFISVFSSSGIIFNPAPNDLGIDMLYRNDGNGVFVDVAEEVGVARHSSHTSGFFWDYDNDGDLDLFVRALQFGDVYGYNLLYRNDGNGTFTEVAEQVGIVPLDHYTDGTDYGDFDNDGWLDLGIVYQLRGTAEAMPIQLYHNNRDGTFSEVGIQTGLSGHRPGWAMTFVDYDSDGDLDLSIGTSEANRPPLLYRNNGTPNHWLQLKLVGRESNRDGIGARAEVAAGELDMMREVAGAAYHQHAEYLPLHFGLGRNTKADVINVRWPSGITQTFTDIPGDQRLTIDELDGILTMVRRVLPGWGNPDGGTPVRIEGEHFLPGSTVLFDGAEAGNVRVESVSLITAITPPGERGYVDVEVIHPDSGAGVLRNGFRYTGIQISSILPDNGSTRGGERIQIDGSGFQQGAEVGIGGKPLESPSIASSLIRGTVPPGEPGVVDVSVANPDGQVFVLKHAFTYIPPPEINRVSPDLVPLISTRGRINIYGSGFDPESTVQIGGIEARTVTLIAPIALQAETPIMFETGSKDVVVVNPDGQRAVLPDAVEVIAPPKIQSVEPSSGGVDGGTRITIIGEPTVESQGRTYPSLFTGSMDVLIGGEEAEQVTVVSDHVITALTPPGRPGLWDVEVMDRFEQSDTLKDAFSYNDLPQINRVVPDNGRLAGGTRITVQGSSFLPGARVFIRIEGGTYKEVSSSEVMSSSVIVATTPPGPAGPRDVVVLNPDGQEVVLPEGFTYNPIPTITRLIPNHGPSSGGSTITVEGTGFLLGARVVIGEKAATTMVRDDMTIEAVAPPNPQGVWDVRVVNPDTQEVVMPGGFVSVGEVVYNYPNPFRASQGTTFRYVTKDPVLSVTVKIFNMRGRPIGAARQIGSNEVKWLDPDVYAGIYVYVLEAELEDGKRKQVRNVMEVME